MRIVRAALADQLSRSWVFLLLRGLAAIAFGILTWMRPDVSLESLTAIFGAYVLIDGVLSGSAAVSGRHAQKEWWVQMLGGLIGIGVGIIAFVSPHITALSLLFYIGVWAIVEGVLEILLAARLRKEVKGEWRLVLAGVASVVFGAALVMRPGPGALAALWVIAAYAVGFGILLVMLAFKMRAFGKGLAHA